MSKNKKEPQKTKSKWHFELHVEGLGLLIIAFMLGLIIGLLIK